MPGSLAARDYWRPKVRTLAVIAQLGWAQLLVAVVPFRRWRHRLGAAGQPQRNSAEEARRVAADVEWGARRLTFPTKCLPRAMALSWMLRRRRIPHAVVIAVRPPELRGTGDSLHAWVEVGGEKVLGELPGPWIETLRVGEEVQRPG